MLHYGLDIFTDFNFKNKYSIKEKDNLVFIKIRFNDINEWSQILSNIFNKQIKMYNDNLTETKEINNLYKEFKEKYIVPVNYLNYFTLHDTKFNIYNNEDEKIKYINYWKNKL
jgi:mRNA degradation ribonuclease J1/J2